ncbi:hypothetical protein Goarm_004994 [Gossypium armourianum]|uniref:Uncharacterized protein n=1 Tax=Gossypium armourianum TaxID=34283 RepID=A0A7J9JYH8_9ROSI|nr:hypothetical protein [Gossypium armourianum]
MGDVKEGLEVVEGHMVELDPERDKLKGQFNGELTICKATVGKMVLVTRTKPKIDDLKPKKFKGNISMRDVGNFLREME